MIAVIALELDDEPWRVGSEDLSVPFDDDGVEEVKSLELVVTKDGRELANDEPTTTTPDGSLEVETGGPIATELSRSYVVLVYVSLNHYQSTRSTVAVYAVMTYMAVYLMIVLSNIVLDSSMGVTKWMVVQTVYVVVVLVDHTAMFTIRGAVSRACASLRDCSRLRTTYWKLDQSGNGS